MDADLEDIENIAGHIKSLYYKKLPIPDLPLTLEETESYLKKQQQIMQTMIDVESRAGESYDTTAAAQSPGQGSKRVSRFS